MANLNGVINSYSIEYGIEFNQTYTLNPTVTGTGSIGSGNKFTLSGASGSPVYYPSIGPIGGKGSWLIPNNDNVAGALLTTVEATLPSTWADGDYSMGFWFMFPTLGGTYSNPIRIFQLSDGSGPAEFEISLAKSGDNWLIARTFDGSTTGITPPISEDTWYFISVRKSLADETITFTVNDTYANTVSDSSTGTAGPLRFGFDGNLDKAIDVHISNFYIGTSANIDALAITNIYTAGITPPAVVKYYDGSAWQEASDQKVFNGSAWVDWDAKRWTGAVWTPLF